MLATPHLHQADLFNGDACTDFHPTLEVSCQRHGEHSTHSGTFKGREVAWKPNRLGLALAARDLDPESSHKAASRDFDIQGGVTGLARDILTHIGPDWMTGREIVRSVFGPGPYTYDQAVSLNKVQTVCLNLHRSGQLDRSATARQTIAYKRRTS
jgi:hypothetical protein